MYYTFSVGDKAAVAYSTVFSDRISFKYESGTDKATGKVNFLTFDLVRGDMLKGVVSKLGCKSFPVTGSNNKVINCWAYTNENIVYLLKVDVTVAADGDLSLNNIYRNFYNTGTEQYITGCVITDQFIVCSSDNLSSDKPKERTSVIVFRIYNSTTRKDYYEYAKLKPTDLKDVIP